MDPILTTKLVGELVGSFALIAFGCGINMNLTLNKSYGAGNTASITGPLAWGFAVAMAVVISMPFDSGGHFNPAVSIGLATAGLFKWTYVLPYIGAQAIGSFFGAILVWFLYRSQFEATKNEPAKLLGVFATNASVRNPINNFASEAVATFFLLLIILSMGSIAGAGKVISKDEVAGIQEVGMMGFGAIGALPAGFMIFTIGMAFGGVTGWSLNPTRDLMPRLAHSILPIEGKGSSDWGYGVVYASIAPLVGCILAGGFYHIIKPLFFQLI